MHSYIQLNMLNEMIKYIPNRIVFNKNYLFSAIEISLKHTTFHHGFVTISTAFQPYYATFMGTLKSMWHLNV